MEINRDNYEAFILDYAEGTLSVEEMAELLVFLEANPDLRAAFEDFENIEVPLPGEMSFDRKELLKKSPYETVGINETNYEHYLVAALEGDLNAEEQVLLKQFLVKNPALNKEQSLFEKTLLAPDKNIVFRNKLSLKRAPVLQLRYKTLYYYASSVAAAFIFVILLYNYNNSYDNPTIIAEITETTTSHPASEQIAPLEDPEKEKLIDQAAESHKERIEEVIYPENPKSPGQNNYVPESIAEQIIMDTVHKADTAAQQELLAVNQDDQDHMEEVLNQSVMEDTIGTQEDLNASGLALSPIDTTNEVAAIRPSGRSKTALSLKEFIAHSFKKNVLGKEEMEIEKDKRKISFFDMAQATIRGTNKLLGTQLNLSRKYNDEGEVTAVAFSSEKISVYRSTGSASAP